MKVLTSQQMKAVEEAVAASGTSFETLMRRAGDAVSEAVREREGNVLILVGPGKNGGDGLLAGADLQEKGRTVHIYSLGRDHVEGLNASRAEDDGDSAELTRLCGSSRIIVDALLGTGQNRPPQDLFERTLSVVQSRAQEAYRVAVDIPTGVDADSGRVMGSAFQADVTISMGFPKVGNVVWPGAGYCGNLCVSPLGMETVPIDAFAAIVPVCHDIKDLIPQRTRNSNKGTFGRLLIVGGSRTFHGAPALCSIAALRIGAGLVEVATTPEVQQSVAAHTMEPIFLPLPDNAGYVDPGAMEVLEGHLPKSSAIVIGPGLGLTESTSQLVHALVKDVGRREIPAVIDADALNALSKLEGWWRWGVKAVVTPHPGEMARLTGLPIEDIQADRLGVARRFAAEWSVIVVLKGAGTVVASPEGSAVVNPTGGANLASAGTGDVLSGIVGGLLAQGLSTYEAATVGVFLHGMAGDMVSKDFGDAGTVAGDLLSAIPRARLHVLQQERNSK